MIITWSISGVPRMIHTNTFVIHRMGSIFDMEPKVMISPSGIDAARVIPKMISVTRKPCERDFVTSRKLILN